MAINKKYKDTLCRMIFSEKDNLLSLYNALNHSNYTNVDDLLITSLEDVIYLSYKNDLSFLIYDDSFLVEHQSTINPNMALRSFMYFSRLYEGIVDSNPISIYSSELVKIPTPHSFVLYNGDRTTSEITIQKLSDSFLNEDVSRGHEWITTVLNINAGHNQELLNMCKPLSDYMYFVNCVKKNKKKYQTIEEAIDMAIQECIQNGVLVEILKKHKAEVKSVCLSVFDQEKYENSIRREGIKEGMKEGIKEGRKKGEEEKQREMLQTMFSNGLTKEEISKYTGICIELVESCLK